MRRDERIYLSATVAIMLFVITCLPGAMMGFWPQEWIPIVPLPVSFFAFIGTYRNAEKIQRWLDQ